MCSGNSRRLCSAFQASIDQGKVPQGWKSANIIPLFKKGNKRKAEKL